MRTVQRVNYIYNSVGIVELCEILFFFLVLSAMKLSQNRYVCFEGRFLNYRSNRREMEELLEFGKLKLMCCKNE